MNPFKNGDRVIATDFEATPGMVVAIEDNFALCEFEYLPDISWFDYKRLQYAPAEPLKLKTEEVGWQTSYEPLATVTDIKVGKKYDGDKPDLSLVPATFLAEVALAFQYGEKKYGRYNYLLGMDWHRLVAAAMRHITAFNEGEDKDAESGRSHLGHAGACIAMLAVFQAKGLGKDTRHKP